MITKTPFSVPELTGLPIHCGPLLRSTLTIHNAFGLKSSVRKIDIVCASLQRWQDSRNPLHPVFLRARDS